MVPWVPWGLLGPLPSTSSTVVAAVHIPRELQPFLAMVLDTRAVIAQEKQRRAPGWGTPPNDKVRPGVGKAAERWYHFVISKLMRNCWHFSGMAMWLWDRRSALKGLPLPWPSNTS